MLKLIAVNVLVTVILVEITSSVLLKERIQRLFPEYLKNPTFQFGRAYPRWHFSKNTNRGFDIEKNSPPVINSMIKEDKPYFVFGNDIGCFDKTPLPQEKYYAYLAGDSFTWGYTPLDKKFGTLLEELLQKPVAACGIGHTGQIHQFSKFKEITNQLGYYPDQVIVNVFNNDIANDFAHPHTTVVSGYQVDFTFIRKNGTSLTREEISIEELQRKYEKALREKDKSKGRLGSLDPRKFSASAAIAGNILKLATNLVASQILLKDEPLSVYDIMHKVSDPYPIYSSIAGKNRKVIADWINHSAKHKYNLIFSDLRTQSIIENLPIGEQDIEQSFCDYIRSKLSTCYSFASYLSKTYPKLSWDSITWKTDGHFNHQGNKLYAEFLAESLRDSTN
jgi:hypothetical protein